MPIIFYGLKSCDSCRAALKALAAAGIDVDHRDVRDDGVPAETLRQSIDCLLYTSPSPRDRQKSRMPSSA